MVPGRGQRSLQDKPTRAVPSPLPKAWRLGNRPNLRQMHHDACSNRVPPTLVESQIVNAIEKLKALTSGASAAGAKVHNLPERTARYRGRRRVPLRRARPASGLGVRKAEHRSKAVHRRDDCGRPSPGLSQCHRPCRSVQGRTRCSSHTSFASISVG